MVKKVLRIVRNKIIADAMLEIDSNNEIIAVICALTKSFFELIIFASLLSSSEATLFADGDIFLQKNIIMEIQEAIKLFDNLLKLMKYNMFCLLVHILPAH